MSIGIPYKLSVASFLFEPPPNRKTPRIQLPLKFGTQQDPQLFILDTGSPNGILWRKDIVGEPESLFSELSSERLEWLGGTLDGKLFKVPIRITAEHGEDLHLEDVCFFVPHPDEQPHPQLRPFLGMSAMQRFFFGFDFNAELFYFAPYC